MAETSFEDWAQWQQNRMVRFFARRALEARMDPELWAKVQAKKEELRRQGLLPEGGEYPATDQPCQISCGSYSTPQ